MSSQPGLLAGIVSAEISPSDLMRANAAVSDEADGDTPVEIVVVREFANDRRDPFWLPALMFRLQALAGIVVSRALETWIVRVEGEEFVLADETLFSAAALSELKLDGRRPAFDPYEFIQIAMAGRSPGGRA